MKENIRIFTLAIMLANLLLSPTAWASGDIDSQNVNDLENSLQDAVRKYNQIVTDGESSLEDVLKCTNQIDQIVDELKNLGMGVEFEQTSDVLKNNKNEMMPATISATVVPIDTINSQSYHFSMNESQKEALMEIYVKDVTKGEFIEKVFPEALEVLPEETIESFYNTPMIWPESYSESDKQSSVEAIAVRGLDTSIVDKKETSDMLESNGTSYNRSLMKKNIISISIFAVVIAAIHFYL